MAIKNRIGAPVTGEDFYGRANELSIAYRYLDEGQSLLLSAPRRIGKSSFAKRLLDDKKARAWRCIYIDLQGVATQDEFIRTLINSFTGVGLMEKAANKVKDFLDWTFKVTNGSEIGGFKIDLNQRTHLEALYNRLSGTFDYEQDTLIVIDELPLFLGKLMGEDGKNRNEVEFLLNWLRSIRQNENSRLRWIFCGSVGLRNFTNHYRMSQTINDLVDFELGELTVEEASGLIRALAEAYNLTISEETVNQMLLLIKWPVPYFIQLLIDRLISKRERLGEHHVVLIDDVELAVDDLSQSDYFITWDERLDEYRDLEKLARKTLDTLSVSENGLSKETLLQIAMEDTDTLDEPTINKSLTKVLEMLQHDGYIIRDGSNRKFRSPFLQRWWKYKFID